VVCVCRSVGAAEVAAALAGPTAAKTTDGLKRRCGVGFGDCQGNRCLAAAIEHVAEARAAAPTDVEKHLAGSWLVASAGPRVPADSEADGDGSAVAAGPAEPSGRGEIRRVGVVVVGGGMAGIGAAVALAESGIEVLVVDRGATPGGALSTIGGSWWTDAERAAVEHLGHLTAAGRVRWWSAATVVGLGATPGGWAVEVLAATNAGVVESRSVVLATGSYVAPREHRSIDGPRPAGIMTADFAADALERGWLPGRRAVVVGDGRLARGTAERLTRAGLAVVAAGPLSLVGAVRGERRLEAVAVADRWVAADTLVLADAVRPASFLLRGLGIGDDRPGVAMAADATGALVLAGLWAAGTCVDPRVDHDRSLAAGAAAGDAVAKAAANAVGGAVATARARP
jgi:bacterioferritin-associated ferredoxin